MSGLCTNNLGLLSEPTTEANVMVAGVQEIDLGTEVRCFAPVYERCPLTSAMQCNPRRVNKIKANDKTDECSYISYHKLHNAHDLEPEDMI